MIKEYCIIYEEEKREKVYASNPSFQYIETTVHELTVPAMNIVEVINYAINNLKVLYQDIKEVFEVDVMTEVEEIR